MSKLSEHERRTIRMASVLLVCGLLLAGGLWCARHLQARRLDYRALLQEAQDVRDEINLYQDKARVAQKLIDTYRLDPMKLDRATLVAKASAAIQKAAADSGVTAGVIRESPARGTSKEMATIQFDGSGPASSVMALLYQLERAGSPLIIDSMRMSSDNRQPGALKVDLTIVVLDFDQWKKEERPDV